MFTFGREKKRVSASAMIMYGVSLALCLASTLVYIYPSMRATSLMYDYSDRMKKLVELKELNKKLRLETAALSTYNSIEKRAVEKLGFVVPEPGQVVIIAKK